MNPEFIIYCGPMFSTKTTSMFLRLERFELQHRATRLFKPIGDERYSTDEVVTHSGWKRPATRVSKGLDILKQIEEDPPSIVAVDEAFMIQDVYKVLPWLFKNGVTIVVASLDLAFNGKSFKEVEKMLPWATEVHKCPAVCTVCGANAFYTHRKTSDDEDIIVGGAEMYEPRCFSHHPVINEGFGNVSSR